MVFNAEYFCNANGGAIPKSEYRDPGTLQLFAIYSELNFHPFVVVKWSIPPEPKIITANQGKWCELATDVIGYVEIRMQGELSREKALRSYEQRLSESMDILLLSVVRDGHMASLFSQNKALNEKTK